MRRASVSERRLAGRAQAGRAQRALRHAQRAAGFPAFSPAGFEHEGELNINLFSGERCLYSLAFTLGQLGVARVAYAGGLQGWHSDEALETYRALKYRRRYALLDALSLQIGEAVQRHARPDAAAQAIDSA